MLCVKVSQHSICVSKYLYLNTSISRERVHTVKDRYQRQYSKILNYSLWIIFWCFLINLFWFYYQFQYHKCTNVCDLKLFRDIFRSRLYGRKEWVNCAKSLCSWPLNSCSQVNLAAVYGLKIHVSTQMMIRKIDACCGIVISYFYGFLKLGMYHHTTGKAFTPILTESFM